MLLGIGSLNATYHGGDDEFGGDDPFEFPTEFFRQGLESKFFLREARMAETGYFQENFADAFETAPLAPFYVTREALPDETPPPEFKSRDLPDLQAFLEGLGIHEANVVSYQKAFSMFRSTLGERNWFCQIERHCGQMFPARVPQ